MKLAYIISVFPKASETFVYREVISLQQLGINPMVFACSSPTNKERQQLSPHLESLVRQTFYLEKKLALKTLITYPLLALRLSAKTYELKKKSTSNYNFPLLLGRSVLLAVQLRKQKITHLHAHWPYSTVIGFLATQIYKCNFSVSIHAHEVAHENGHFPSIFPLLKFASFCNQAAMSFLMQRITNADSSKAKSHLIYHGVNINDFDFLPMPEINNRINIFSAGRLTKTKGFHRLVQACSIASKAGINIHLTILGNGPEKERIEEAATQFNFVDNLHMEGWVPHNKVSSYIEKAHLFALMADTTYHDGLPNVVLESMAAGRPVIISPLPAAEEAVTNNKEGYILDSSDDTNGFARHIEFLYYRFNVLKEMGMAARKRIEHEHADYIHINKLASLFSDNNYV